MRPPPQASRTTGGRPATVSALNALNPQALNPSWKKKWRLETLSAIHCIEPCFQLLSGWLNGPPYLPITRRRGRQPSEDNERPHELPCGGHHLSAEIAVALAEASVAGQRDGGVEASRCRRSNSTSDPITLLLLLSLDNCPGRLCCCCCWRVLPSDPPSSVAGRRCGRRRAGRGVAGRNDGAPLRQHWSGVHLRRPRRRLLPLLPPGATMRPRML